MSKLVIAAGCAVILAVSGCETRRERERGQEREVEVRTGVAEPRPPPRASAAPPEESSSGMPDAREVESAHDLNLTVRRLRSELQRGGWTVAAMVESTTDGEGSPRTARLLLLEPKLETPLANDPLAGLMTANEVVVYTNGAEGRVFVAYDAVEGADPGGTRAALGQAVERATGESEVSVDGGPVVLSPGGGTPAR